MNTLNFLQSIADKWQLLLLIIFVAISAYAAWHLITLFINRRHLRSRRMVWREITPPARIAKTPEATEQLFSVMHGLRAARHLKDKLLQRAPVMSFEIVSTKQDGIRFLMYVDSYRTSSVEKIIEAYIPDAKVALVDHKTNSPNAVIEFKETGHFVLPLTLTSAFAQHDPLAYVTNAMTKLGDDEQIILQLVAMPVKLREASHLSHKILGNENILEHISGKQFSLLGRVGKLLNHATSGVADITNEVYMGTTYGHKNYYDAKSKRMQYQAPITRRDRPARTLSAFELELMETMHKKVTKPLFQVDIRLLIVSDNPKEYITSLKSALDGFSVPPYQSLKTKLNLPWVDRYRTALAEHRLPSLFRRQSVILSVAELASLYHFPSSQVSKIDNLNTSLSRTLPAPISLKQNKELDIVLGVSKHHGVETPIGLTATERERHVYIIGGTGNGKTTMLQYAILQDMQRGKGFAVVDPHGDMAETLLRYVPEHRVDDVVYFNPDDLGYPMGLNLLELTPGLTGQELLREKDLITESVISVFRKIFSEEDTGGHRIEYVLRNTIQTALTIPDATLFTVFDLLNDPKYRKSVLKSLDDKNLINFWKHELGKAGDMQKVKMAAGITAKIGRFLFSASARQILEQPKSTIDFDDIINSGKILICNFSKGLLGEDTSELFGITVLAKLQLASLRRARIAQSERRPFHLYVDEFQNFATQSFVQMLSESRKYKLYITMAEQSTSQQKDQQMVNIILANVGTIICFRTGNPHDEQLLLPLFTPYIERNEINNLSAFNFYARLSAITAQEPLSGQTLLITEQKNEQAAKDVIEHSRATFATQKQHEGLDSTVKLAKKKPTRKPAQLADLVDIV